MTVHADVAIIGAGVIGLATAFHIRRTDPGKKVVVLDREAGPGQGNTTKSAAAFRNTFSSEVNRLLSDTSIDYYLDVQRTGFDLKIELHGYLWLFSKEQYESNRHAISSMESSGTGISVLDRSEIRIPGLMTSFPDDEEAETLGLPSVDVGVLGRKCGSMDPDLLVSHYERSFRDLGGEILYSCAVERVVVGPKRALGIPLEPFAWQDLEISKLETSRGDVIADEYVIAAGAWTHLLLDPVGVDCHMKPRKTQLFQVSSTEDVRGLLHTPGFNDLDILPFTILPKAGVYIKPATLEQSFWIGCADRLGRGFNLDDRAEEKYYIYGIYQILSKYFPHFRNVPLANKWAGSYAYNTIDGMPIIFREENMVVVAGTSGSGIMKADAIGRIAAAISLEEKTAYLYGERAFRSDRLSLTNRDVEQEEFVI